MLQLTKFTLIELLVVIAIISVLAALILPTLSSARDHAYSVSCINNQRSISVAIMLYAEQNQSYYPSVGSDSDSCWAYKVGGDRNQGYDAGYGVSWTSNCDNAIGETFVCATEPRIVRWSGGSQPRMRSHFSLNYNLHGKKLSNIMVATEALLIGDNIIQNSLVFQYNYASYFAFRHGGEESLQRINDDAQTLLINPNANANMVFSDGHSESSGFIKIRNVKNSSGVTHINNRCSYIFTNGIN